MKLRMSSASSDVNGSSSCAASLPPSLISCAQLARSGVRSPSSANASILATSFLSDCLGSRILVALSNVFRNIIPAASKFPASKLETPCSKNLATFAGVSSGASPVGVSGHCRPNDTPRRSINPSRFVRLDVPHHSQITPSVHAQHRKSPRLVRSTACHS